MSVLQNLQGISGITRIRTAASAPTGLKPYAPVDTTDQTDLLRARSRLLRLYRQLETLAELANVEARPRFDKADTISNSPLGLDLTQTAATLSSSDEINASPMSFSPFGPDWDLLSSALLTIGGEYDGSNGTGSLNFEVRRAGTRGLNDLRIRVEPPVGNVVNVNILSSDPLDRQYDLGNGLYFQLGPGILINRDTAAIQVYDNVGAVVDPDKPLGGLRNDNPNLQFGSPAIADGSFQLNGDNISVSTSDSISDVIDRINNSAAGVTSTFNAVTEQIDFIQNTPGSAPTIDLQSDTSNFLAATKLDSANTVAGVDPETIQALDNVAAFSGVSSGNIVINGEQITVDTASDSLTSMIDKINASAAGVTASFDTATQRVMLEADNADNRIEINSNGTGFFAALNLREGRVDAEAAGSGVSRQRSYRIADALESAFAEVNYLFRDSSFVGRGEHAGVFRSPLESAIRSAFGGAAPEDFMGVRFADSASARQRGDYATIDRRSFTSNLQLRGDSLMRILQGEGDNRGLVEGLLVGTTQALRIVASQLGQAGTFVDTFA